VKRSVEVTILSWILSINVATRSAASASQDEKEQLELPELLHSPFLYHLLF